MPQGGVDYMTEAFDWTNGLKARMKSVFNIREFRLCQEGVCNANMDGRDIICIMPTGGGKSLTYQLPALLMTGCTLVISPLISLMTDQILHLREAKIEAVMLTSATRDSEKKQTIERLKALAERRSNPSTGEIKLIYVTPEKMSKDKSFRALLQKVDAAKKLARIVIDEAHCVSQLGHDFRKDYKELHLLRKIFPSVPIMALSATCGARVMKDLISILGLRDTVSGTDAPPQGTILFTSPLYRKNLHYRVVPKPESSKEHLEVMKTYILENHANETGIIYCLSKKDTETVAEQLREQSEGRIKTGVYHADVDPGTKERLHAAWREGKVKVVCATIAFGMGIDKGDVRFVLHHSKSLEGFYQESGRAGRDGKDSDCILYYRPQDASTMAATAARDTEGEDKLHAVLDFAEDLTTCRKVQFAEYFSHSSQLSVSSWSTSETGALDRCGHCDNCTRPAGSTENRDCTLAAWQLLKITQSVRQQGGKLTLTKLAALARGGKGAYDVSTKKGRRQEKETFTIDLDAVASGSVDMSKLDIEHLIVRLMTKRFFTEDYQQTAYSMNVYVAPGQAAARLNHQTRQTIEAGSASVKYQFDFIKPGSKAKKSKAAKPKTTDSGQPSKSTIPAKRKNLTIDSDLDDSPDDMYDSNSDNGGRTMLPVPNIDDDSDEGEFMDWSYSMRDDPKPKSQPPLPTPKKRLKITEPQTSKANYKTNKGVKINIIQEGDIEVVELSSD
ncbi:P-loop containing nucleoside triphosphate hydrolase protein [Crepidotus variabilis]|uniref:ATP-dependent DNA helicase n=1 Tax=Crepidotus variabilis TaxID=179855 RepID=A0A9P6EDY6_9AGAR|nr:P-loop containing nucleoside triphosphate hydrolase protein [Crepidotus variabilis]